MKQKKYVAVLFASLLLTAVGRPALADIKRDDVSYVQDYNAIVDVLNKYNEGGAKARSALMKPAFNNKASIHWVEGGSLRGGPIQILFDVVDKLPQSPNAKAAISRVEIAGTAASARIDTDDLAGYRFTDFLNLLKIDGKWVVVSKIYDARPAQD